MKILFTGGGTGGHFYPIIAVAEAIRDIAKEEHLIAPELYYVGPEPYDEEILFQNDILFKQVTAGKLRRYHSLYNIVDSIKTAFGILTALWTLFMVYPDVVFSKGGYASFPTLFAARFLRIPVIIHDSDAIPGRVSLWSAKFARRIGVSYPETADYFKTYQDKVASVGNPVRKSLRNVLTEGAHEFLGLDPRVPTILIMGGSQGAQKINDVVLSALTDLVSHYQVIHQTGKRNFSEAEGSAKIVLEGSPYASRYHAFAYLNDLAMRMAAGAASVVISRAGSGSIFEIASWGKPSIVVPLDALVSRDQQKNAYAYARTGAAIVIEEKNLTPHLLVSEINRLIENTGTQEEMSRQARAFFKPDAARVIAKEIIATALKHE